MSKVKEDVEGGDPDTELCRKLMDLPQLPKALTLEEKKYLLAVERGDMGNVRRMLQRAARKKDMNENCVDSLGRGALTLAIDGENMEMVELLVVMGVETRDALLQAINAEFVEAVELLLEHEELIHKEPEPYSWQKVDPNTAMFTPDITPLILAAHRNNYEIIKILLDRGATLPMPHDIKCGCDDCIRESREDSLRHSLSRVNEYRALASPSLIALSSSDPILTAFQLSWEMRNLAFAEQECKSEYLDLRRQCQQFAVDLLHQSRSSQELAIILNHDPDDPPYEDGEHMKLARLELAIDLKQKKFVAHPNIQQLLAAIWYEGVPGFRRKMATEKLLIIVRVALLFPFYCSLYMLAPNCATGKLMRKPFMKFLIHASSYLFFLLILILVSQRAEVQVIQLFGTEAMRKALEKELMKQRGNGPTFLELVVVVYVMGFIWEETQEIFIEGMQSYLRNMWNFIDFTRNSLYVAVAVLRCAAYAQQAGEIARDPATKFIPREQWDAFDPQLIAEGLFAAANIFSALKLVHLFSINPHLGPLQISLGRMVIDIVKFFFIYSLVLFAFACGLNQLLWYFAELEKRKCYVLPGGLPDWENAADSCMKWRSFGNVFESSQSLFWASFGMVGLENFELAGIKSYTRFWGLLMFGSYSVINVIVLLNLLIAMMSNSYAMIDEHSDVEWKFARTRLWMSYFEESATLPPPFNIMPTPKLLFKMFRLRNKDKLRRMKSKASRNATTDYVYTQAQEIAMSANGAEIYIALLCLEPVQRQEKERDVRYTAVMRALVWRYVSAMHRRCDEEPVTEDDINEVKGDISALRYELIEVFAKNGMDVSCADRKEKTVLGKRMKVWERRLMKDFHVAPVAVLEEEIEPAEPTDEAPAARFRRVARLAVANTSSARWDQVMQGVCVSTQIGRCRNRESFKNQQSLQKAMAEARRLVLRSPLLDGSRSGSPLPPASPARSLMDLLRDISSETEEAAASAAAEPGNTLSVASAKSRPVSPATSIKALKSPSLQPLSPVVTAAVTPVASSQCPSSVHSPPPVSTSTSSAAPAATRPVAGRPESSASDESTSPPPGENTAKPEPSPLKSTRVPGASPPRVVKRRAGDAGDIAVARPAAPELRAADGALPPPPPTTKAKKEPATDVPTVEVTPVTPKGAARAASPPPPPAARAPLTPTASSPSPPQDLTAKPTATLPSELEKPPETGHSTKLPEPAKAPEPVKVPAPAPPSTSAASTPDSPPAHAVVPSARVGSTSSTERLIPTSPEPLRAGKKLDDVKTIKRQPKTGWL